MSEYDNNPNAGENLPSEEKLLAPQPAEAPVPKASSHGHKRLTIALICLAVVLLAAGAFLMIRLLRHPLKKVADAGRASYQSMEKSPVGSLLNNLWDHGSVQIKADVSQMEELIGAILPISLKLDASAQATLYMKEGSLALQADVAYKNKNLLDALLLYNEGMEIAVSSEAFFGKTNYGLNLKNFSQNIVGSVLDPATGSEYAVSEKHFELLKKLNFTARELKGLWEDGKELVRVLVYEGVDYLVDHAQFSSEKSSLTLGEPLQTQALIMTMNEEVFCGLLEHLISYCRTNEDIQAYLLRLFDKLGFIFWTESAEVMRDKVNLKLDELKQDLSDFQERLKGTDFTVTFHTYEKQLIRVEAQAVQGSKEAFAGLSLGPDPKEPREISFEFRRSGGTVLGVVYQVTTRSQSQYTGKLTLRQNAEEVLQASINWNKENGNLVILAEDLERHQSFTLQARMIRQDKVVTIEPQNLNISNASSKQDIPLKGISLTLNEAADFPTLANYTEVTSMSEEQVKTVFDDLKDTFSGLFGGLLGGFLTPLLGK